MKKPNVRFISPLLIFFATSITAYFLWSANDNLASKGASSSTVSHDDVESYVSSDATRNNSPRDPTGQADFGSTSNESLHLQRSRKQEVTVTAESLYAILNDYGKMDDWGKTILQIASLGPSEESSRVLMDFITRPESEEVHDVYFRDICLMKTTALDLLAFTGGEKEYRILKETFLSQQRVIEVSREWISRLNTASHISEDRWYFWNTVIRGGAALGMLVSGDPSLERTVRDYFDELRTKYDSGNLEPAEEDLAWQLVDMLAIHDITKVHGREFLLNLHFGESHAYRELKRQAREKYVLDK